MDKVKRKKITVLSQTMKPKWRTPTRTTLTFLSFSKDTLHAQGFEYTQKNFKLGKHKHVNTTLLYTPSTRSWAYFQLHYVQNTNFGWAKGGVPAKHNCWQPKIKVCALKTRTLSQQPVCCLNEWSPRMATSCTMLPELERSSVPEIFTTIHLQCSVRQH
jgi:hypothetical protein